MTAQTHSQGPGTFTATADPVQSVAVVGGGPAGLMAAEMLAAAGLRVDVYDAMPSVGRKFLLAGIGGMNITHSEEFDAFVGRYGSRADRIRDLLADFDAAALRAWIHGLGIDTFVGSSGRVFPTGMKAAPLLRAWLHRLRQAGVTLHPRHRCTGWDEQGALAFATPAGPVSVRADAIVLALGGASWARLGSDGAWTGWLQERGVGIEALQPANCGFECRWSEHLRQHFAGSPLKSVVASCRDGDGREHRREGEMIVTAHGLEGSLVYALSSVLRGELMARGEARLVLDLAPARRHEDLAEALARPRGKDSLGNVLRKRAGIEGVKAALLREVLPREAMADPSAVAAAIKALPLRLVATRPIDEAISTAGGVRFEDMDRNLMLRAMPGVFCAGEMLDWEAPTGGYLLTACLASGRRAGAGALCWLATRQAKGSAAS